MIGDCLRHLEIRHQLGANVGSDRTLAETCVTQVYDGVEDDERKGNERCRDSMKLLKGHSQHFGFSVSRTGAERLMVSTLELLRLLKIPELS